MAWSIQEPAYYPQNGDQITCQKFNEVRQYSINFLNHYWPFTNARRIASERKGAQWW